MYYFFWYTRVTEFCYHLRKIDSTHHSTSCIATGAVMSTVNFSEVIAKLSDAGIPKEVIHEALSILGIEAIDFDMLLAYDAGLLRPLTRQMGLSLGDHVCLALARHLELPVITTDKVWESLSSGVVVQLIR